MTNALTSHLVSGTPELQFAIDEVPTSDAVATVVHVVQSEPSAADRGLETLVWRFVDAHAAAAGGDAASALRLLHAAEQLHVYEWLLKQHPERLHAQMEAASTRGG